MGFVAVSRFFFRRKNPKLYEGIKSRIGELVIRALIMVAMAAFPPELIAFINDFYKKHKILLDPLYTRAKWFLVFLHS